MNVSRRNFLKRAGGVAVVAAAAPVTLAAVTHPREALAEQRIPEYEPPRLSANPLNMVMPANPDMMPLDLAPGAVNYLPDGYRDTMMSLGFYPDAEGITAGYVHDVLLKGFPQ